ncbi:MAG: extracellular solute-binding protein [Haloarculaceae archaeon]
MSKQRVEAQAREWSRLARGKSRRAFLKAGGVAGAVALAGCSGGGGGSETTTESGGDTTTESGGATTEQPTTESETTTSSMADSMTIFHAGSLTAPFKDAETKFQDKYGVQVNQEAKGSVGSTKKITEQGRKADILAVSDYTLLRDMLLPKYGDWYAIFATNAMTLAYTDQSTGADEIGPDNWWKILSRDDVSVSHSDPNVDPNGYRSILTMKLGAVSFDGSALYDQSTAKAMIDNAKVAASTETTMIGQLKAGKLDYAWEYQSAGASHDVQTVDLQPSVDLSKATSKYADHYAKAQVETENGTITGAPIAYGITVPGVAEAPKLGAKWVNYMITEPGQQILTDNGFAPVAPAVVPKATSSSIPDAVLQNASPKESLGPLKL